MDATPVTEPAESRVLLAVFQEIGIIEQLARSRFESVMPDGLLLPHFSVLDHLAASGDDKSLKSIAAAFQVSKGAMTNTIQRLERRGLVEVRPDPRDGRGKRVFLTAAGRAMRQAAVDSIEPELRHLAAQPGIGSFRTLLPQLEALRRALDALDAPPSPAPGEPAER